MRTRSQDTEREIAVLKYLKDHRVLSVEQIGRRFWTGEGLRSPKAKMSDLAERGLVHPIQFTLLRSSKHYSLTSVGFSLLKSNGYAFELEKPHLGHPLSVITGNFEHHSRVADIRIALEIEFVKDSVQWIPEIAIWQDRERFGLQRMDSRDKRLRSRIPDGIIIINGKSVVFEYEHASYKRGKFNKIIETWEGPWKNQNKLIVAPTQERAEELVAWCRADLQAYQRNYSRLRIIDLTAVAGGYLFMSYEAIVKNGFERSEARTPLTPITFKEWITQ